MAETMKTLLKRGIDAWEFTRSLTYDMLLHISDEQLVTPLPRPLFNTFGKQFQELGAIQEAYIDAMKSGKLEFAKFSFPIDEELVKSKESLREYLMKVDAEMKEVLKKEDPNKTIDWGMPDNPTLVEHLNLLNQHETLHHGQLIAYCYLLNITFPESWVESWGLPPGDKTIVNKWLKDHME